MSILLNKLIKVHPKQGVFALVTIGYNIRLEPSMPSDVKACGLRGAPDAAIVNSISGGTAKWRGVEDGQQLVEFVPCDAASFIIAPPHWATIPSRPIQPLSKRRPERRSGNGRRQSAQSVSWTWPECTYSGYDRNDILPPVEFDARCVRHPDSIRSTYDELELITTLMLDLRPISDPFTLVANFKHVHHRPSRPYYSVTAHCHSLPQKLQSLPFNPCSFPNGPDV